MESLTRYFKKNYIDILQKIIEIFFIAKLKKSNVNTLLQEFIVDTYSIYIKEEGENYILTVDINNPRILYKGKKVNIEPNNIMKLYLNKRWNIYLKNKEEFNKN